ncbi:hypothetical protein [Microbacterium istanbulense]|uniref:Uncharacterized protein n=1 Tax=Microbacterium istanbulense TaxID=3122049 RepID=A0ABU8LHV8_9MICO
MALLTRTWPALASWGSGLLHLSLGASVLLAAEETGGVAAAVAVGLLLCGAAELLWGALGLRAGRPVAPRAGAVGALASIGVSGGALALGASPLAVAAAVLLTLVAAAAAARSERQDATRATDQHATRATGPDATRSARQHATRTTEDDAASSRPWVAAVGVVTGAALIAALVTPALSTVYVPGADAPTLQSTIGPHAGH